MNDKKEPLQLQGVLEASITEICMKVAMSSSIIEGKDFYYMPTCNGCGHHEDVKSYCIRHKIHVPINGLCEDYE